MADQRLAFVRFLHRLFEAIPERHVEKVQVSAGHQAFRHRAHLGKLQPETLRRQPHAEQKVWPAALAHALNNLVENAVAVLHGASVTIFTPVGFRAEELTEHVAVRPMQLHAIEAGLLGPHRGTHEVLNQLLNLGERERSGAGFGVVRGAHGLHAVKRFRRPVAGMMQLHDGHAVVPPNLVCEPLEAIQLMIAPRAELTRKSTPHLLHMRSTGHGQPEAALRTHREPAELFIGQDTIVMALGVGQRGQHEAVLHAGPARECQLVAQARHGRSSKTQSGRVYTGSGDL